MNDSLIEQLLHEGESASLDYKRDQYPFVGASDEDKSELLKDILALANGWRHAEAYILVGVDDVQGGRSTVVGVPHHIPENDLQQFVNTKTNRPVTFSYRAYPFEGKQISVITVPQQDRPIYLTKNYGKLQKHVVYYRQGTSTAIATPDDIARMGTPVEIKKMLEGQREEAKKEQVRVTLGMSVPCGFHADIYNSGEIPVYIKEVALGGDMENNATMKIPFLVATATPVADGKGSISYVALGPKSHDLPARKEVRFFLPRHPSSFMERWAACPQESVWLSVSSYGGEICRIGGSIVQPYLTDLVNVYRAMEEAEKPRILRVVFYLQEDGCIKKEVGSLKAQLVKPGGIGPFHVQLEPIAGVMIPKEEIDWLAQELVNGKGIGKVGKYEWRIE